MKKNFSKKGMIFFWLMAVAWGIFIVNYLMISGWWQNRGALSPIEIVGNLGGLAMPLVILFLLGSYFDRSERVEREAKKIHSFMEELIYPTDEGAVYTKELTANLAKQIKEFRAVYTGVTEHTNAVQENLQRWIEGLNKLVKAIDTQTVSAVQKMAGHIENLAEITHQSNRQAEKTTALLAGQADILNDITRKTSGAIHTFSKELNDEIQDIQNLSHALETAKGQIIDSQTASSQIVKALTDNTARLEKTLARYDSLKSVEQQAQKTTQEFSILAEQVEKRLSSFKNVLNQMQGDMTLIAQGLNAHTQALENHLHLKEKQQKDLLLEASEITEQLQQFSVELAHLFSPKNEESLWKQYYAGDKAVFMRYLKNTIKESKAEKIRTFYQKNISFQTAVNHYMKAFEQMTYEAKENAEGDSLLGLLIGSDIGRLYMVLAEVIKGGKA